MVQRQGYHQASMCIGNILDRSLSLRESRSGDERHFRGAKGDNKGEGFVDYVLWGDDGKPLGLIEAKRTNRNPIP